MNLTGYCLGSARVETMYGYDGCNPNLHLHGHLAACLQDYGPLWLFGLERLNGILGSVSTNHQAIEILLMRKFISNQQVLGKIRTDNDTTLTDLLHPYQCLQGSLKYEQIPELPLKSQLSSENASSYSEYCSLIPPVREGCLQSDEVASIEKTLRSYFGDSLVQILVIHAYSKAVVFRGTLYGSIQCSHANSSLVYVLKDSDPNISHPAFVQKYLSVQVLLNNNSSQQRVTVFLAAINWLIEHDMKNFFG